MKAKADTVVGFLSPPHWIDPSPAEFQSICSSRVVTQQTMMSFYDFTFGRIGNIAAAFPEMLAGARLLGSAGCSVVASTGTPFGWAGLTHADDAYARREMLSDAAGAPVILAGLAIIDGLKALGAERVAVATPYYNEEWREAWSRIVTTSGIEILQIESMDQQGLVPADGSVDGHGWAMTDDLICESLRKVSEAAPTAQAAVITGAGARTLTLSPGLEQQVGIPVLASDTALFWAVARAAGLELKPGVLGALTEAS